MFPLQTFTYPNGKKGVFVYKTGYSSSASIFGAIKGASSLRLNPVLDLRLDFEPLLFPFREPVERFISAFDTIKRNKKYAEYSIDDVLDALEQNTFKDAHFFPTSIILRNACLKFKNIYLYKFPEHYEQMLRDGGYEGDIPHKNKSQKKSSLTASQEARVEKHYAKDVEIFKSIKKPGQEFYFLEI